MKNKLNMVENTTLKAGTLLISERPFAFILSSNENGQRCDYCLIKGKVLKCSVCHYVHYCGRACQKEAWNEHKWECNNLKRIAPKVLPDAARMLAKIINRLNKGDGNSYRSFYSANSFRMWKDLMSHYSDLKVDKKRMDHFSTLCMVLFEFFKDSSLPNTVELMGIYGRMCINSFTILDTDMNSIGTAVYLAASILDHSCAPNAVATFDGHTINIRTTQDMPSLDWSRIRISYIDLMKTAYERQVELMAGYYFLCQCDRCLDDYQLKLMHAAKCPNSLCDNLIQITWKTGCQLVIKNSDCNQNECANSPERNGFSNVEVNGKELEECGGPTHCSECGSKVSEQYMESFKNAMEFTELHLQNMKNASTTYVDVCKFCLDKQEGFLHHLNVMHAQTLDHAFDALIQVQLWDQACVYAQLLIPCFRNYYGDRHPLLGLLHLKYGKILLYKLKAKEALEQFRASEEILKITHGDKHPLYKEELLPLLRQAMIES